jgi:uncharacterized membrane protein YgcG
MATIFLAFSSYLRAVIWSIWTLVANWILITTRIYYTWLIIQDEWNSQNMMRRTEDKVRKMQEEVRKTRRLYVRKREGSRRQKERGKDGEGDGGGGGGGSGSNVSPLPPNPPTIATGQADEEKGFHMRSYDSV